MSGMDEKEQTSVTPTWFKCVAFAIKQVEISSHLCTGWLHGI